MTTVAIIQPNYLPWKGYFDILHDVDVFVFYDDVQFTKQDWRTRNRIKTSQGLLWLTVPVGPCQSRLIRDVPIVDRRWQRKHWSTIRQNYSKSPYFDAISEALGPFFENRDWDNLSQMNQAFTRLVASELLGIETQFVKSSEISSSGRKQDRLMSILDTVGATRYVSGPAAKAYIDPAVFVDSGIDLIWKDYSGYPAYPQLHGPFEHGVSIIDLLYNCGPESAWYIWGWRRNGSAVQA